MHGYYLARELNKIGYDLYKINGKADPHTTKLKNKLTGLFWILRNCELIYIRMDYFLNFRNLIARVALLFNKKVVVELNSPSDELHLFGKSISKIHRADKRMASILKRVAAVIVVSKQVEKYCREALNIKHVYLVENGGEVFNIQPSMISESTKKRIKEIRKEADTIVVWSGSLNRMQNVDLMNSISDNLNSNVALVMLVKHEDEVLPELGKNVHLFKNLPREEVEYIISQSNAGLALYGNYDWSRWGFYNSSLKVFEYLNNGLSTVSNKEGSEIQKRYPNFHIIRNSDEITTFLNSLNKENSMKSASIRTWKDVADETSEIFKEVIR